MSMLHFPSARGGSAGSGGGGSALFTDDFTSYTIGNMPSGGNANFTWGGGNTGYIDVVDVTSIQRSGGSNRAVRFNTGSAAPPGNANTDPELDFLLGADQSHAFFRYYLYWPSGSESPSFGPGWSRSDVSATNNNKFIRFGDSTAWATTTLRFGASTFGNADGNERLQIEVPGPGFYNSPGASSSWPAVNLANKQAGRWIKIEWEIQMNTTTPTSDSDGGHGLADGIMRCWEDGSLILDKTNVGMAPANSQFRVGYLFGALNMAPDNVNGYFYMSDFAYAITGRV